MKGERPTVATIDLGALAVNYHEACRLARGRPLIAVVKADAYGHGARVVARRLVELGCRSLAVLSVGEAAVLRDEGLEVGVLVLGGIHDPDEAEEAAALRITVAAHTEAQVGWLGRAAERSGRGLGVEVEVDTGMRRMGVAPERLEGLLARVRGCELLRLEGIYTHLACADEPQSAITDEQLTRFQACLAALEAQGFRPPRVHVANSAALLASGARGERWLLGDAVRPGLCLYGVSPAPHLRNERLRPVMTVRSRVVTVRRLAAGDGVGYGATYRAAHAHWIATLPAGYADGVPWSSGNRGSVWIAGQRRPILGRVSMDFITVDTGEAPVEIGEEAILFGEASGVRLPVEEAAGVAGSIPYELLVRVGRRVPREVVG